MDGCSIRRNSTFVSNINDPCITVFEKLLLRDVNQLESKSLRIRHNLTHKQTLILENLGNDESIIIKPADKGSGIVILDQKDYKNEALWQLNDETAYQRIHSDPTATILYLVKVTG